MLTDDFDWQLTLLPKWTPASRFGPHLKVAADPLERLLLVRDDVYLMVNQTMGSGPEDPGVGSVLWAPSLEAAMLIVTSLIPESPLPASIHKPPSDFLGFSPVTYAKAETYERKYTQRPLQERVEHKFPDATFLFFALSTLRRDYIFSSVQPSAEEEPIGIQFVLLPS